MKVLLSYLLTLYFAELQYLITKERRLAVYRNVCTIGSQFAGGHSLISNCKKSAAEVRKDRYRRTPAALPDNAVMTDNGRSLPSRTDHSDLQHTE